ncbi:hypothetical protein P43SY_007992 [Pythium insidiosum]|uniref:AB hydrolase-1 domain-containing protein n=1 Tax=Pythium insidiosum TaxID=114742 RepID=A0AAD5LRN7_PYTIN|nr:hypothetical protein P43SY_007992 [Pythium insidiosum]
MQQLRRATQQLALRPTALASRLVSTTSVPEAVQTTTTRGNYAINYVDFAAPTDTDVDTPTIVLIHGAPGSFQDFKYMIPLLNKKARVIGINLPGNGGSRVPDERAKYSHLNALNVGEAAMDAITELCAADRHVFIVGHSFGGHTTLHVTAQNDESRRFNLRGMGLIASAGIEPHRALMPRANRIAMRMLLSEIAFVQQLAEELIKQVYVRVLRFPSRGSTNDYVAGLVRCATTDFDVVRDHARRVQHVPAFFAWAEDDPYMQQSVFTGLSGLGYPGPRYAFARGGHNIQKTRAAFLTDALLLYGTCEMMRLPWSAVGSIARRTSARAPQAANGVSPTRWYAAAATRTLVDLPDPLDIRIGDEYNIKYVDVTTAVPSPTRPTIVLIHGSPGSFHDFRHLIPLLQDHARVVAVNLPANGGSQVLSTTRYYDRIRAIEVGRASYEAVVEICKGDENVFVLGHSFGAHTAINVAAFNEEQPRINIRGIALLAPASIRPHRALRAFDIGMLWRLLRSDVPFVEPFARWCTRFLFVNVWRFPGKNPPEYFAAGIVRCASTDFSVIKEHVKSISKLPAFVGWARDDAFMEEDIFTELSALCGPGPRIAFKRGGHNIQKTKASYLAQQLIDWTQHVVKGDAAPSSRSVDVQP